MAHDTLQLQAKMRDLFAGPFPGHAIWMDPEGQIRLIEANGGHGDFTVSDRPVGEWLGWALENYEIKLAWHEAIGDDAIPYVKLSTGTQLFAAAFGCPVHQYDDDNPCARPIVSTAAEADRLETPSLDDPPLARVFELGRLVRERVGPEVPIGVPDIQSALDIAALIWRKEDLLLALITDPDAVNRLAAKCQRLLIEFFRRFPQIPDRFRIILIRKGRSDEEQIIRRGQFSHFKTFRNLPAIINADLHSLHINRSAGKHVFFRKPQAHRLKYAMGEVFQYLPDFTSHFLTIFEIIFRASPPFQYHFSSRFGNFHYKNCLHFSIPFIIVMIANLLVFINDF